MRAFKFPSAYTIFFILTVVIAALTWIVPAGEYAMVKSETMEKMVPVAGTYQPVEANPQGIIDVLMSPIDGFYDRDTYTARAIDVVLFILIIGGYFGVVNKTGTINTAITGVTRRLKGREILMIPILMGLFATGGTVFGMAEETIAFYALIMPVVIAAGYDAVTGVAIIMIGAGIGCLGSTINPFSTVIASNEAGISFTQGMGLRFAILGLGWLACVLYVMRYATRVRHNPELSLVADLKVSNEEHFLKGFDRNSQAVMTGTHKRVLAVFMVCFGIMIWGVSIDGWWMAEISALFLGATIVTGVVALMGEQDLTSSFVNGARELLGVALIITLARGLVVVMDNGNITHTLLFWAEGMIEGLSPIAFVHANYWVQTALSFLVPSPSGLAVMTMPIMAPLADFAGVGRHLVVTGFQSASGLPNLVTPTSAVVMGGLALGRVPYGPWLRFVGPLLAILVVIIMAMLSIGVLID